MLDILSVENMRQSDAACISGGVSSKELMYRAGSAALECFTPVLPIAFVCGTGNNAGDGYVMAGILKEKGIDSTLILLEERFSEDGRFYYEDCIKKGISVRLLEDMGDLKGFGTVVDCILGTGFKGSLKGKAAKAVRMINGSGAYIVSIDINSGLNGDSGMAKSLCDEESGKAGADNTGCVISDITVSIGSFKPGHFLNMAKDVMKKKVNCDIDIKPLSRKIFLAEQKDMAAMIPERKNFSNKGSYGYTALIGGSKRYSGALRLAAMANAAMRSGSGVVKVGLPKSLYHDLLPLILESTVFPLKDNDGELVYDGNEISELIGNVKTVAFGMGAGTGNETGKILDHLLKNFRGRLIVDADGLNLLSKKDPSCMKGLTGRLLLTPHLKEFERLTGKSMEEILNAPIEAAEDYASRTGAAVLLKGPSTIVTDGNRTCIIEAGCPGMATAGSGDVLSGILSAVCAYVDDIFDAAVLGAYINGKAGERAQAESNPVSMTAGDTAACISKVVSELYAHRKK